MLQINTTNDIFIDGKNTGLKFAQKPNGTVIYTPECKITGTQYKEHAMPHARYATSTANPASGVLGRDVLEQDILALIGSL